MKHNTLLLQHLFFTILWYLKNNTLLLPYWYSSVILLAFEIQLILRGKTGWTELSTKAIATTNEAVQNFGMT